MVLENMKKSKGLIFLYSQFKTLEGLQVMSEVCLANGYEFLDANKVTMEDIQQWNLKKGKRFALYTGEEDLIVRSKLKLIFRDPRNCNGDYLQVLMATSAGAEGLDLKNIRQVHILEPYWNTVRTKQVEGRAVRLNSHRDLPESERTVEIFEYQMKLSEKQLKETREDITSDEYIYEVAKKKEEITNRVLTLMKEMSVDCVLFANHHDGMYQCKRYENVDGWAYLPSIYRDFVYQMTQPKGKKRREVKKMLIGGIDKKNCIWIADMSSKMFYMGQHYESRLKPVLPKNVHLVRKVAVDMDTWEVYESIGKDWKKIGRMNEESQFVEE
jgi:hypothetical protein